MDSDELKNILRLPEGLKLDFKCQYHLDRRTVPDGVNKHEWIKYINGQWDELTKDIIALTNGNVGVSNDAARLIIGAGDKKQDGSMRPLFDTSYLNITDQQILATVNSKCEPAIASLLFEQIDLNGTIISVITIPPSRYLHECSRDLEVTKGEFDATGRFILRPTKKTYTRYTAFIRKGETTSPASNFERRKLEEDKRFHLLAVNEGIKSELTQNLQVLLYKNSTSEKVIDLVERWSEYKIKYTFELHKDLHMEKHEAFVCLLILMTVSYAVSKLQTQFINEAVTSRHYLEFDVLTGQYVSSKFLTTLMKLQEETRRLTSYKDVSDRLVRWIEAMKSGTFQIGDADALMAGGIFNTYTNVVKLSTALLQFLLGYVVDLSSVEILDPAVNEDMREKLKREKVTYEDVMTWLTTEH